MEICMPGTCIMHLNIFSEPMLQLKLSSIFRFNIQSLPEHSIWTTIYGLKYTNIP